MPYEGEESDTRDMATLKAEFLKRHLDALVRSYQTRQAKIDLESIATETVD
tara:strand:- start:112 stop:264 length:153 start_codon:yes stop_codon:yes gene_type:complete